ncbi:MAG: 2-amino-4-oxopentanoate thiolase subunit OrtA [Gammaproteobacteria bacterium]
MNEPVEKGCWVEIYRIVLAPGERAPQVPEDTAAVPLEMRVKGYLTEPAWVGGEAEIVTRSGRILRGRLTAVNPAYGHGFGAPIQELSAIGAELRSLLSKQDGAK